MARPIKDGVDYFPKDTDFYSDYKVRLLRAEFGAKGMYLLDYLLCDLYGKNGYYMQWDKNTCFLVSDGAGCGCSPETVAEFINGCIRCSFFDKGVYESFGVLTSAGIQRRYIRMFNSREEINIYKEYWLLDMNDKKDVPSGILNKLTLKSLNSTGNPDKSTENPDKNTVNTQSKIKENKVKENINNKAQTRPESNDKCIPKKSADQFPVVPEYLQPEWDAYIEMRKRIRKPLTPYAARLAFDKLQGLTSNQDKQKQILNQSIMNGWQGLFELNQQYANQMQGSDRSGGSWQDFKPSR